MNQYNTKLPETQAKISKLTKFQLEMFNYFLWSRTKHKVTFISQSRIAKEVGCGVKTVNRAVKVFKELNLLKVYSNTDSGHQTLFYEVHQDVLSVIYDGALCKLLPNLKRFRYFMLCLFFAGIFWTPFAPSKNRGLKANVLRSKTITNNSSILNSKLSEVGKMVGDLINKFTKKEKTVSYHSPYLPPIPKKEEIFQMNDHAKPFISDLMREITKSLNLSKAGQIRLLIYHEDALRATFDELPSRSYVTDKFVWFETHCHGYSIKNNLPIQLELFEVMKERFKIKDNADLVLKQTKIIEQKPIANISVDYSNILVDYSDEIAKFKAREAAGEFDELKRMGYFFPMPGST